MTKICATVPALPAPEGVRLIAEAAAAARLAAVVILPAGSGPIAPDAALPMIAAIQKAGAAALIYADAQLARALKADGVHLPWSLDIHTAAEEAREILGQGGIVGADAGVSRHDAMELGELGVDYVAFGLAEGTDAAEARAERDDFVAWWAEIFEIPVVALDVSGPEEAAALASAAADFVSVPLAPGASTVLAAISAALSQTRVEPAV